MGSVRYAHNRHWLWLLGPVDRCPLSGGKADITIALHVSASDPKRTSFIHLGPWHPHAAQPGLSNSLLHRAVGSNSEHKLIHGAKCRRGPLSNANRHLNHVETTG